MPRRFNVSQLRQIQSRQRQAARKVNDEIRRYNSKVSQRAAANKRAIDKYNSQVRTHNSRVRAQRARLQSELRRLANYGASPRYTRIRDSAIALSSVYTKLETSGAAPGLSELAENEVANSLAVVNAFHGYADDPGFETEDLSDTKIHTELTQFSNDYDDRWRGALFALNAHNPDAARHFCSSSREIIAGILNTKAPDEDVEAWDPNCDRTDQGTPTRRAKIQFCLTQRGMFSEELTEFINTNAADLNSLLKDLNSGTHGPAGKYSMIELRSVKTRVEDAILFVCRLT